MAKYLLEIACEEIPARFIPAFMAQFQKNLQEAFKEARLLETEACKTFASYRRLTILFENVLMLYLMNLWLLPYPLQEEWFQKI